MRFCSAAVPDANAVDSTVEAFLLEILPVQRDEIRDLVHLADRAADRERDAGLFRFRRLRHGGARRKAERPYHRDRGDPLHVRSPVHCRKCVRRNAPSQAVGARRSGVDQAMYCRKRSA
jgi:hypothetical protein